MNGKAQLRINSPEDFERILTNLRKFGIGNDISIRKIYQSRSQFPLEIDLDIDQIFAAINNPIIRSVAGKFTKKMDQTFTARIMAMI